MCLINKSTITIIRWLTNLYSIQVTLDFRNSTPSSYRLKKEEIVNEYSTEISFYFNQKIKGLTGTEGVG